MARHPDWFERLEAILAVLRQSGHLDRIGRQEMQAIFSCSERDSIRLLHKFGAEPRHNALSLPCAALLVQLEAIRAGSAYAAFLRQRQEVAQHLTQARAEAAARQVRVASPAPAPRLADLPRTITWRRTAPSGPGRLEIVYDDGADLLWQLAEFLSAAGSHREEFFAGTEPAGDPTS